MRIETHPARLNMFTLGSVYLDVYTGSRDGIPNRDVCTAVEAQAGKQGQRASTSRPAALPKVCHCRVPAYPGGVLWQPLATAQEEPQSPVVIDLPSLRGVHKGLSGVVFRVTTRRFTERPATARRTGIPRNPHRTRLVMAVLTLSPTM